MRIAILGGGVAGIASAIAFRQQGFDVTKKTAGITMAGRSLAASLFERDENSRRADFTQLAMAMADGWRLHLPLRAGASG